MEGKLRDKCEVVVRTNTSSFLDDNGVITLVEVTEFSTTESKPDPALRPLVASVGAETETSEASGTTAVVTTERVVTGEGVTRVTKTTKIDTTKLDKDNHKTNMVRLYKSFTDAEGTTEQIVEQQLQQPQTSKCQQSDKKPQEHMIKDTKPVEAFLPSKEPVEIRRMDIRCEPEPRTLLINGQQRLFCDCEKANKNKTSDENDKNNNNKDKCDSNRQCSSKDTSAK